MGNDIMEAHIYIIKQGVLWNLILFDYWRHYINSDHIGQ